MRFSSSSDNDMHLVTSSIKSGSFGASGPFGILKNTFNVLLGLLSIFGKILVCTISTFVVMYCCFGDFKSELSKLDHIAGKAEGGENFHQFSATKLAEENLKGMSMIMHMVD